MAVSYKLVGKKDARKVVKTIDITEESYLGIKNMIDSGVNFTDAVVSPLISDVYLMFGGNCYKTLVTMALEQMIAAFVHQMEDEEMLSIGGEEAYQKISSIILPLMCYTSEDGEYAETLNFFNPDPIEICDIIEGCLKSLVYESFKKHMSDMMGESDNVAGEAAMLSIMYIVSDKEKDTSLK